LARTAADGMFALAHSRRLALSVVAEQETALAVVDADRISQVISNLVSNALKFTPAGGRVDLIVRRAGEMQEVVVSDTGAGIAPDFLPRVFEPFRQADASHARPHGGLGLGLAIVHRIVEMHGGEVTAESAGEGRGATFRVRLPAATESQLAASHDAGHALDVTTPDLSGVKILVVDDDADTRELVTAALRPTHATVNAASSADEALATALVVPPDVLVTDLAMPYVDGYTFKKRLEAVLGDRMPTLLIALSAFAAEADVKRSIAHGFHAHLTKPFDAALLLATIRDRLGARAR
jgi:CheY-like chemotaxis protein